MPECNCCALGGLFLACTMYNNKTTINDLFTQAHDMGDHITAGRGFSNGLHEFFTTRQLLMIELAFENGTGWFKVEQDASFSSPARYTIVKRNLSEIDIKAIKAFNATHSSLSSADRMKVIMKNIVYNNGEFIP